MPRRAALVALTRVDLPMARAKSVGLMMADGPVIKDARLARRLSLTGLVGDTGGE